MSGQFPEFKNEMDKIVVPDEKLNMIIMNTIKDNQGKKQKRKKVIYSLSAAVVGFGLFIGSAIVSPAMAKVASHIPLVGNFFNDSKDEGLRIAGQKGLTQVIEQTSKDNGITITMNEVFYDGTRLTFGYTHEALLAIGELERPTIEVNGKEINFSAGYSGDFITPLKYKGMIDIAPTEELPEEFELKMRFDAVGLIAGNWEFAFPVKQSNKVTVIKLTDVKSIEEAEVKISSLKLGPAGTNLTVNVVAAEGQKKLDPYSLHFYIIDENSNVLDLVSGSGTGDVNNGKETVKLDYLFTPLKEKTKKVKIVPYTIPKPFASKNEGDVEARTEYADLDSANLPIVLDQGDFGKVVVTDIEYVHDKTIIHFEVESDFIIDNHSSRNPIWLEDANGKNLFSEDKPLPERIEGNRFKQEFATGKSKGLQLKTYKLSKPDMYEAFEIEIP